MLNGPNWRTHGVRKEPGVSRSRVSRLSVDTFQSASRLRKPGRIRPAVRCTHHLVLAKLFLATDAFLSFENITVILWLGKMSGSPKSPLITEEEITTGESDLPISSIVRAVCQAAGNGPDLLYEVMVKLSLMVEATAPTYGLSIWTLETAQRPRLKWAEGLDETELTEAERAVAETLAAPQMFPELKSGDSAFCFVLAKPVTDRQGAALYGCCVRPLSEQQAKNLRALIDVTQLAHSHVAAGKSVQPFKEDAVGIVLRRCRSGFHESRNARNGKVR